MLNKYSILTVMLNGKVGIVPFVLVWISLVCLAACSGCGMHNNYYMGRDSSVVGRYLGYPLPPKGREVWIQAIEPPDYKIVILIAKIAIEQSAAESYCRVLDLAPSSVSAALMSPGSIDDRDVDTVRQWWNPPTVLNAQDIKVCFSLKTDGGDWSGFDVKAIWWKGYLYVYKQGPIGKPTPRGHVSTVNKVMGS